MNVTNYCSENKILSMSTNFRYNSSNLKSQLWTIRSWSQWTYYLLPASGQNCSDNERRLVDCSIIKPILHWELVDSQEHPGTCGLHSPSY